MMSCPIHGLMLEPAVIVPGVGVAWEQDASEEAPVVIRRMDSLTWDALTSGGVDLPRRRVHAAVWFRVLRAVLDELNRPLSCVQRHRDLLAAVWHQAGAGLRAGQNRWKPFEVLAEPVQRTFLRAAAIAMSMIEAHEVRPLGAQAELFCPEPVAARDLPSPAAGGPSGHEAPSPRSSFNACMEMANELVMLARRDSGTAREVRDLLRFGRRDPESLAGVDALLNELGIPVPEDVT